MDKEIRLTIPKSKPILTNIILITIGIVFIFEAVLTFKTGDFTRTLISLGGKWNIAIKNGEYWRLITYGFLHGSLIHLLLNMVGLHVFAREVEVIFGSVRFLAIFLISIFIAGLFSYMFSPGIAIGSSGGLFGVLGALMYFFYNEKKELIGAEKRFKSIYTLIIINILFGFMLPNIDNSAHLGGLISGMTLGYTFAPKYESSIIAGDFTIVKKKKQTFEAIGLLLSILFSLLLFKLIIVK